MNKPTLEFLDKIRKEGFRPGVVACIIHGRKLLLFYKEDHKIWQLPQGGISNKETYLDALARDLTEELGGEFVLHLNLSEVDIIDEDRMEFKPGRHEVSDLETDAGESVPMLGKHYYFCVIKSATDKIDITQTQFDQFFWVTYIEAYFLANKMYQKGKRRITLKIITKLQELGLIQ